MSLSQQISSIFSKHDAFKFNLVNGKTSRWFNKFQHSVSIIEGTVKLNNWQIESIQPGYAIKQGNKYACLAKKNINPIKINQQTNNNLMGAEDNETKQTAQSDPLGVFSSNQKAQPQNKPLIPPSSESINNMMYFEIAQLKERIADQKGEIAELKADNKSLEKENRELRLFKETAETKNMLELERIKYNESNTLAGAIRELAKPDTAMALSGYIGGIKGGQLQGAPQTLDEAHKYIVDLAEKITADERAFLAHLFGMLYSSEKTKADYQKFFKEIVAVYEKYNTKVQPLKL